MASVEPSTTPRSAIVVTFIVLLAIAIGAAYVSNAQEKEQPFEAPPVKMEYSDEDRLPPQPTVINIQDSVEWLGRPIFVPVGTECTDEDPCTPTIFKNIECGLNVEAGILVCRKVEDLAEED